MLFDYDENNEDSIIEYSKQLEGKTFREIIETCREYVESDAITNRPEDFIESLKTDKLIKDFNAKGQLGNVIEKYYFGYKPNGNQEADLANAGIEIKQTPIDITKKGKMRAGERLSITMISYDKEVEEDFYKSHVWEKIQKILLIQYVRDKTKNRFDYEIKYVTLFTPPAEDLEIIVQDYNKINQIIKEGRAHELSEGDTMYLGACTKGASASKSWRPQFYNPDVPAKRRNFCLKNSYMNYVLENYVLNQKTGESIINDTTVLKSETFEQLITNKIDQYVGKTDKELCEELNVTYNNNKAQWTNLAYRMLGIKGNHAQEFKKANIITKVIRIEENGSMKESMSLPVFKFLDLIKEEWEDSTLYNYFESTKFFFVVFKSNGSEYELLGSQFWNMPASDIEVAKECWLKTQNRIKEGIHFEFEERANGIRVNNDLPGKDDNDVIHVRPHARESAYKLNNGFTRGDIKKDANVLPDGQYMTTQSFWFNNSYILKQLKIK